MRVQLEGPESIRVQLGGAIRVQLGGGGGSVRVQLGGDPWSAGVLGYSWNSRVHPGGRALDCPYRGVG